MKKKFIAGMLVMSVALFGCANNDTAATSDATQVTESAEPMDEIIDEAVDSLVDYTAFEGDYQDTNSERATMYVSVNDDQQSVRICVSYSESYDINDEWFMDAIFEDNGDGTGILSYTNCRAVSSEYNDEGDVITTEIYTDGSGYFTCYPDGTLLWDGASEEDLHECLFMRMPEIDLDASPVKECAGGFQDSWSGRASCEITANADDSVHISVMWSNGAASTCFWEMDAIWVDENAQGYLTYDNCEKFYINFDEDGNDTKEVEYTDGEGFFTVKSFDKLVWDGAGDEGCMECVFERIG